MSDKVYRQSVKKWLDKWKDSLDYDTFVKMKYSIRDIPSDDYSDSLKKVNSIAKSIAFDTGASKDFVMQVLGMYSPESTWQWKELVMIALEKQQEKAEVNNETVHES